MSSSKLTLLPRSYVMQTPPVPLKTACFSAKEMPPQEKCGEGGNSRTSPKLQGYVQALENASIKNTNTILCYTPFASFLPSKGMFPPSPGSSPGAATKQLCSWVCGRTHDCAKRTHCWAVPQHGAAKNHLVRPLFGCNFLCVLSVCFYSFLCFFFVNVDCFLLNLWVGSLSELFRGLFSVFVGGVSRCRLIERF